MRDNPRATAGEDHRNLPLSKAMDLPAGRGAAVPPPPVPPEPMNRIA
ncbi:MAG: hypothetical protein OXF88_06125 [Rhodobacteraceae bacterium]|nr:hypothetical protein [Paracoccaceae bacterium]MCY4138800.1 hypothetical protein [Paracoccaceae bacterium]